MPDTVHVSRRGAILEIVLDRPKANAIDLATSQALGHAFCAFRDCPDSRVAIITGAGDRFFSAGWELGTDEDTNPGLEADYGPGGMAGLTGLFNIDKPIIAAVNGYCVGAGFELVLGCDIVVAAEQATFMMPEVNVGIPPEASSIQRAMTRLPRNIASEMLYTGTRFSAARMAGIGFVNHVVAGSDLVACARQIASRIADAAPLAVKACKAAVSAVSHLSAEDALEMRTSGRLPHHVAAWASEDSLEGGRSFVAKRRPVWKGR